MPEKGGARATRCRQGAVWVCYSPFSTEGPHRSVTDPCLPARCLPPPPRARSSATDRHKQPPLRRDASVSPQSPALPNMSGGAADAGAGAGIVPADHPGRGPHARLAGPLRRRGEAVRRNAAGGTWRSFCRGGREDGEKRSYTWTLVNVVTTCSRAGTLTWIGSSVLDVKPVLQGADRRYLLPVPETGEARCLLAPWMAWNWCPGMPRSLSTEREQGSNGFSPFNPECPCS